jgi:predicted DsbA family dithiol-disulfide isomerase
MCLSMKKPLTVDVWSDIVCPWCAVGKRRLEAALARFPHKDDVEIVWRAFELDPSAPAGAQPGEGDNVGRLAQKYGRTRAQAEAMLRELTETAARDGLAFKLESARPGNTFDGHRLLHLAATRGVQDAVKERFFRGYMSEGEAIGDPEILVRLAAEAGLDADEARAVLASDRFAREVREEEALAREMGIRGVPFFVFGGKYGVSGAQPAEVLLGALEQAWASVAGGASAAAGEGATCGPEGCA